VVNFNFRLAQLVEPDRAWRIVTSDHHSTVWDGRDTLFEFNFLALGIPAEASVTLANVDHLPVGRERQVDRPVPLHRVTSPRQTEPKPSAQRLFHPAVEIDFAQPS
jgi:hypothetical protein